MYKVLSNTLKRMRILTMLACGCPGRNTTLTLITDDDSTSAIRTGWQWPAFCGSLPVFVL